MSDNGAAKIQFLENYLIKVTNFVLLMKNIPFTFADYKAFGSHTQQVLLFYSDVCRGGEENTAVLILCVCVCVFLSDCFFKGVKFLLIIIKVL